MKSHINKVNSARHVNADAGLGVSFSQVCVCVCGDVYANAIAPSLPFQLCSKRSEFPLNLPQSALCECIHFTTSYSNEYADETFTFAQSVIHDRCALRCDVLCCECGQRTNMCSMQSDRVTHSVCQHPQSHLYLLHFNLSGAFHS